MGQPGNKVVWEVGSEGALVVIHSRYGSTRMVEVTPDEAREIAKQMLDAAYKAETAMKAVS